MRNRKYARQLDRSAVENARLKGATIRKKTDPAYRRALKAEAKEQGS